MSYQEVKAITLKSINENVNLRWRKKKLTTSSANLASSSSCGGIGWVGVTACNARPPSPPTTQYVISGGSSFWKCKKNQSSNYQVRLCILTPSEHGEKDKITYVCIYFVNNRKNPFHANHQLLNLKRP